LFNFSSDWNYLADNFKKLLSYRGPLRRL
jgi:hypothetical protein